MAVNAAGLRRAVERACARRPECSPADLPARGTLSARDVRVTTRVGRIVRYLIPEFTPS
jgi:hypothetical protein